MTESAGFLIYTGVMPLIKTYLTIISGYVVARMGLFPEAAVRGASQITMNMALPALLFANVVPAFTPSNISALGPLFLTAFTYQVVGFLAGYIIREVCYVPRNFWQSIVVLCGISSWGNLPTAVVLSITQHAPFDPTVDQALGVSFVSIFIVAYNIAFWMLGAAYSLSWDYLPDVPQGEAAERRVSWKEKPLGSLFTRYVLKQSVPNSFALPPQNQTTDEEFPSTVEKDKDVEGAFPAASGANEVGSSDVLARAVTDPDTEVQLARRTSQLSAPASAHTLPGNEPENSDVHSISPMLRGTRWIVRMLRPFRVIISPVTITLIISLPIALIAPLKALFVDISDQGGPVYTGPDGRPPLAFMIDTGSFVGAVAVPLALVLLGAGFARMTIPRPLTRLPLMAIFLSTMAKMVILPVIGVFLVLAMTEGGLVDRQQKTLRFVMMFLSGTPTAIPLLIVSSLYSPDGKVDTLSVFLFVQYVFMFLSSATLTAVALLLL